MTDTLNRMFSDGQRLPNECLYYIVTYLSRDFESLRPLLLVSKFFFKAVLPHFIRDPGDINHISNHHDILKKKSQRLFALLLSSFLEARLKEHDSSPKSEQDAEQIIDNILAPFGLCLVKPFVLPGPRMLSVFNKRMKQRTVDLDHKEANDVQESCITVDYSKFFMKSINDMKYLDDFHTMIQLRNPSQHASGIKDALTKLWAQYNYDYIESYIFDLREFEKATELSKKMSKLRVLIIKFPINLTDLQLTHITQFIRKNQETFPRKPRLEVDIEYPLIPKQSQFPSANIMQFREGLFATQKFRIAIIEAMGEPKYITATDIPNFYQHASEIGLSQLRRLTDLDIERFGQGEGPAMEAFLKRCVNIETFQLAVSNPYLFTWATNKALISGKFRKSGISSDEKSQQQTQQISNEMATTPFSNVKDINITSSRHYRFAIHALNDAAIAFSSSLQRITLSSKLENMDTQLPMKLRIQAVKDSFALHDSPIANRIGSWPILLPNLRSITVTLDGVASFDLGSLDECPCLEYLNIESECNSLYPIRPTDDEAMPSIGQNDYLDKKWQQAKVDYSLFPVWNLPKLKSLRLRGISASRFDFASLSSMKNLTILHLEDDGEIGSTRIGIPEYSKIHTDVWRTRLTSDQGGSQNCLKPWMWPLPKVANISIIGLPVSMFSLEWLLVCPHLTNLDLTISWDNHVVSRTPLFAKSFPELDTSDSIRTTPFLESKLKWLEVKGVCSFDTISLIELLTIYAPFIRHIESDSFDGNHDGFQFIKAIKDADKINSLYTSGMRALAKAQSDAMSASGTLGTTEEERKDQHSMAATIAPKLTYFGDLRSVTARMSITTTEAKKVQLVKVHRRKEDRYLSSDTRLYWMRESLFIYKWDEY